MLNWLLEIIKSTSFQWKVGFVITFTSASLLTSLKRGYITDSEFLLKNTGVMWAFLFFGAYILLASLLELIYNQFSSYRKRSKKKRSDIFAYNRQEEYALHNLGILNEQDANELIRILREGNQCFIGRNDVYYGNLLSHHIIIQSPYSMSLNSYKVRDSVWKKREEILRSIDY